MKTLTALLLLTLTGCATLPPDKPAPYNMVYSGNGIKMPDDEACLIQPVGTDETKLMACNEQWP